MCVFCGYQVLESILPAQKGESPAEMTDVCVLCVPGGGEHLTGPERGESSRND